MNDALLQSAVRFHEAGQLTEAARLYSDIIRGNPQHFEALYRLGLIHLQSGRFGDAEQPADGGHPAPAAGARDVLCARLQRCKASSGTRTR